MVRPVTRQPISLAANSAKPPQPQPISSTWWSGPMPVVSAKRPVFARLRAREVVVALGEQRGRIGHRPVEPRLVEAVAEVVVGVDVAPRARLRVAVQPVAELLPEPHQRAVLEHLRDQLVVDAEQFEKARQVRRLPLAAQIGLGDADVARHRTRRRAKPKSWTVISASGPGAAPPNRKIAAVGQGDGQAASLHAHGEG